MRTVRITPSRIEEYRCFIQEEYHGFITQDKVIETIKGTKEWTPQANFGSAFGLVAQYGIEKYRVPGKKMLQIVDDNPDPKYRMPKFYAQPSEMMKAQELHEQFKGATYEPWFWMQMDLDYNLRVNAPFKCDWLFGSRVHELKTTTHAVDVEFYAKSLQWRCYLYALKADSVEYHVYPYSPPNKKRKVHIIKDPIEDMVFYPYDNMEQDLREWFFKYVDFADRQGLSEYINN